MTEAQTQGKRRRPDGPNPGILAIVSLALTLLGILFAALLAGQTPVSPLTSTADVAAYYAQHPEAATLNGFFVFGSSVPLGIFAATVYARLLRLGIRVPGPGIAFYGGISASVVLGIAGILTWVLGQPIEGISAGLVHTVAYLSYALGGVSFVGGLGLLVAGIAVPTLVLRLAPRWMAWSGLVIAAVAELTFLSMLIPSVSVALPIARFIGLLWLVVIGFMLPRTRHEVVEARTPRRGSRALG